MKIITAISYTSRGTARPVWPVKNSEIFHCKGFRWTPLSLPSKCKFVEIVRSQFEARRGPHPVPTCICEVVKSRFGIFWEMSHTHTTHLAQNATEHLSVVERYENVKSSRRMSLNKKKCSSCFETDSLLFYSARRFVVMKSLINQLMLRLKTFQRTEVLLAHTPVCFFGTANRNLACVTVIDRVCIS